MRGKVIMKYEMKSAKTSFARPQPGRIKITWLILLDHVRLQEVGWDEPGKITLFLTLQKI